MKKFLEDSFLFDRKVNALLSLAISIYLLLSFANILLDGNLVWSFYALSVVILIFVPVAYNRDISALPPFEILLFLAVPFTVKGLEIGFVASRTLSYLSASGIALLIVVEMDTYTSFRTTPGFSVFLVALTTIAVAGIWAVARWLSDIYLGTSLIVSENLLMWEFAAAVLAGALAGKIFSVYLREKNRRLAP